MPPGPPPGRVPPASRKKAELQTATQIAYVMPVLGVPGLGGGGGGGGMGKSTLLTGGGLSTANALANLAKPRTKKTTLLGQ